MIFRFLRTLFRLVVSAVLLGLIALLASLFFAAPGAQLTPLKALGYKKTYTQLSADWHPLPAEVLVALEHSVQSPARFLPHPVDGLIARAYAMPSARIMMRAHASFAVALQLPLEDTLNWYAHTVYVGQKCYGFEAAAPGLAGKPVTGLSLTEAAELAALTLAPQDITNSARRKTRRDAILMRMADSGALTPAQATAATSKPLMDLDQAPGC